MARIIEVLPYGPNWSQMFVEESARIADVLGPTLMASHHIGSTAVPGLAAKPTIDILLVVHHLHELDACNSRLVAVGYQPKGENEIPGRRYFQKLTGDAHLYHLHAFNAGHPAIARHLNFRDYLIAHPAVAEDYQALKEELAANFRDAPAEYTAGKTDFIHAVDVLATVWRAGQGQG